MNIEIVIIEGIIFAILFTIIIFISAKKEKNSATSIHNYPKEIQDEYFKTHEKIDVSYKSKKVLITKSIGILLFTAILLLCAYLAGAETFFDGFIITFVLILWIGLYDTLFIDWVLFVNMKMFRLEGTEHMDKEYHQK